MPFELKVSIIGITHGGQTSIVKDTITAATCETIEEAELLLEYAKNQLQQAQPFARPLPLPVE